jgi:uncharacterized glyoxalase superfamily protein PhnB
MTSIPKSTAATVVPCLRYRNAPAAIEWLCEVFGFERYLVMLGENNTIAHAQLTYGNGMIMLGSATNDSQYGRLMVDPDQIDGRQTQTVYLVVADADLVYARVKAAGAAILIELADADHGGRTFACRDPEGHVWSIGTYDPWQS